MSEKVQSQYAIPRTGIAFLCCFVTHSRTSQTTHINYTLMANLLQLVITREAKWDPCIYDDSHLSTNAHHTSHGFHQRRLKQPIDFIITMEITFNRITPSPGLPLRKTLSRSPTSSIKTIFSSLTLRMNESTYYNGPSTSTNCSQNGPTKVNVQSTTRDRTLNLDGFHSLKYRWE